MFDQFTHSRVAFSAWAQALTQVECKKEIIFLVGGIFYILIRLIYYNIY